jgi:hypothetical protein
LLTCVGVYFSIGLILSFVFLPFFLLCLVLFACRSLRSSPLSVISSSSSLLRGGLALLVALRVSPRGVQAPPAPPADPDSLSPGVNLEGVTSVRLGREHRGGTGLLLISICAVLISKCSLTAFNYGKDPYFLGWASVLLRRC